jgi:hypothetical protein
MKSRAVVDYTGVVFGAVLASSLAAAGCVSNSGLLIILQNNQPVQDTTTMMCSAGSTPSATATGTGILDLETSTPPEAYPAYIAYPLVQSTLPIQAATPGAVEPNTVYIEGVRGTLIPPPGLTVSWPAGCPADFFWPTTSALLPGTMVGLTAQVISPCQATVIHDLFVAGTLPPDLGQLVMFTIEMRVVGQLSSGSEIDSDKFRFSVRTCIGCLQTGFKDVAQYDFPARPTCSAFTQVNADKGNPCNVAQDYGPLLCCTGTGNEIVCPAPGAPPM